MSSRDWKIFAALTASLLTAQAPNAIQDCAAVTDAVARLSCYDKTAKPTARPVAKPPDPVFENAKAALRTKLKDPGSATFKMTRHTKPNVKGEPTDVVCGFVNARNSYGGYTGDRPFVFFPKDRDVHIVELNPELGAIAPMVYKNFCP